MSRPKIVLPPLIRNAAPEKTVSVASVAMNGRMPMRLTSTPLRAPPTRPTEQRDRDCGPDRIAEREENGRDDARKARHRADAEVEIAHHHDNGHRRGHDRQHADCWLMLSQLRPVMKVSGRLIQKKTRIGGEADQRAVAPEQRGHGSGSSAGAAAGVRRRRVEP